MHSFSLKLRRRDNELSLSSRAIPREINDLVFELKTWSEDCLDPYNPIHAFWKIRQCCGFCSGPPADWFAVTYRTARRGRIVMEFCVCTCNIWGEDHRGTNHQLWPPKCKKKKGLVFKSAAHCKNQGWDYSSVIHVLVLEDQLSEES